MANIPPKKCKICGKEFTPNSCRQLYCKDLHYRICPVCGKPYPEPNLDKFKSPPTTCSIECRVQKRTQTSLSKYGITAPGNNPIARAKSRQTMKTRYGVEYAQESKTIKQKSVDTWLRLYGVDNPQKDQRVQNKTRHTNLQRYGSVSYLSSEQGKVQIADTMIKKYGSTIPLRNPSIKEKCANTNLNRYGYTTPLKNEEIKEKARSSSLRRYGTIHPMSSDVVKQKVKDTFIRNYGVDNCSKSPMIIEKIKQTFFQHYGVHSVMEVKAIAEQIRKTNMQKYGVPYYVMLPNVAKSSGRISNINKKIANKLKSAGIYNRLEYPLNDVSYDIYIPQSNTLLEINPTYTHSTAGNHWNPNGVSAYYHLRKSIIAAKSGYRCMHLWDWDDTSKFINSLTTKTTIYRNLHPELINPDEAKEFLQKYSLYGMPESPDNLLFLGLRYRTKLMSIMGFKLSNFLTNTWTLVCIEQRFHYTIYEGHKNLLQHFIKICHPNKIIAYADYSKTNGEMLENLGFKYILYMSPKRIWSKGRHAIIDDKSIIPEAMMSDGWLPVYNCGYKVYELQ